MIHLAGGQPMERPAAHGDARRCHEVKIQPLLRATAAERRVVVWISTRTPTGISVRVAMATGSMWSHRSDDVGER